MLAQFIAESNYPGGPLAEYLGECRSGVDDKEAQRRTERFLDQRVGTLQELLEVLSEDVPGLVDHAASTEHLSRLLGG